jgi:thiol-disulfide isomerase/thioredoxin
VLAHFLTSWHFFAHPRTHAFLQTTVEDECAAGKLVVVNFFAPECYACKSMQPKLRQIARDNPDAVFLKVNGLVSGHSGASVAVAELAC